MMVEMEVNQSKLQQAYEQMQTNLDASRCLTLADIATIQACRELPAAKQLHITTCLTCQLINQALRS